MKGRPGDLNRLILPVSAVTVPLDKNHYVVNFQGTDYVASDYISRDTYAGMLFGLSTVHAVVSDPRLRDDAREQIEMLVDYLLANNWTWRTRDGSYGERWQGVIEQQYAWMLVAARVNPAKYAALKEKYEGLADLLWLRSWVAVMDPYYSYDRIPSLLLSLHIVLRHETDPIRWQRAYQGVAIARRFIGHHQNAHFNSVYLAADPASRDRLGAENQNVLTRLLRQPRRKIRVDISGDPTIQHMVYTPFVDPALAFLAPTPAAPVVIATYPIPVEKRVSSGFAWSVPPSRLRQDDAAGPDPFVEGASIDFLLPYWMSRYYGAIPAPRPSP